MDIFGLVHHQLVVQDKKPELGKYVGPGDLLRVRISVAEAAHIVPHSQRGSDIIENAICLCPVCHWAFDKGLLGINPEGKVIVSGMVANDSDVANSLLQLNGRQMIFPKSFQMPVTALAWHMRNIFWDIG
jgi:putative restriction endonuclease